MGKILHASLGGLLAFYFISIPLGFYFAFTLTMGLPGLWYGMLVGLIALVIFYQYLISCKYDWDELALESFERSAKDMGLTTLDSIVTKKHKKSRESIEIVH